MANDRGIGTHYSKGLGLGAPGLQITSDTALPTDAELAAGRIANLAGDLNFLKSDGSTWIALSTLATGGASLILDDAYNNDTGERTITVDNGDVALALATGYELELRYNTGAGTLADAINVNCAAGTITDGLLFTAAGTITDAIDASAANIGNAINIGANAIAGTNFNVSGAGAIVGVGLNYGAGSLVGTGDIAINTNLFTVAGASGNTVVAGTLNVAGTTTLASLNIGAIQPAAGNLTLNGATGATTVTIGNLSTGGIVVSDNMTISQPVRLSGTTDISFYDAVLKIYSSTDGQLDIDGDVEVEVDTATLDVNASAAVNVDTAAFSIDGTSSSNVSVTGAQLQLSTITSGEIDITGAGLVDLNAAANLDIDVTGSVDILATTTFSIDGTGASNVSATSGNLTLSTITTGTLILNSVAIVDIDAGSSLDILAVTTFSIDGTGASNVSATAGNLTLSTITTGTLFLTGAGLIDMDAGANIDIDVTGTFDMLASGVFSIDGTGASNVTATSGNLTLSTITSGNLLLDSIGTIELLSGGTDAITLTTSNNVVVNATATGSITLTTGNKGAGTGDSGDITLTCGTSAGGAVGKIKLQDHILVNGTSKVQFYDAEVFINSPADGKLEIEANGAGVDDITLDGGVTIPTGHLLTLADAGSIRLSSEKVTAHKQISIPIYATANSAVRFGILPVIENCKITNISIAFYAKPASAAGTVLLEVYNYDVSGTADDNLLVAATFDLETLTSKTTSDLELTATGGDLQPDDSDFVYCVITSNNADMTAGTGGAITVMYTVD